MRNKATIQCRCNGRYLIPAFTYEAPPAGETAFELQGQVYQRGYERCSLCGHWFGRHEIDITHLYGRDYVDATYGGSEGMRQKYERIMGLAPHQSDNTWRVKRIRAYARELGIDESKGPRLLDVGAGLGVFPARMRSFGWQVTALEKDFRVIDHLESVAGVSALETDLDQLQTLSINPFELITFNKILEHVEDPVSLLTTSTASLSRTGFIYVEVPDVAAANAGPEREEFFIEHHHVFSPASLTMMAEAAKCEVNIVQRVLEPSGKYTLIGFLAPVVRGEYPQE